MVATVAGIHLGLDTHANRPAGNAVPDGSIYSCSTHSLVYKSNFAGNSWATWATLGGTETLPVSIIDAKGDLIAGTAADTASRLAVGVNDQVLRAASGQSTGVEWAYGLPRYVILGSDSPVSSTAFANAGIAFSLVASASYFVEYFLHLDTNATTVGIKLALNSGDAGTTIWLGQFNPTTAPALNTQYAGGITFTKDTQPFVTTAGPGGTRSLATLFGLVQTTTNPDTLQLRHASETNTLTTIYTNSVGRCTRIA